MLNIEYEFVKGGYKINRIETDLEVVILPSYHRFLKIVAIGKNAMRGNTKVNSIRLPKHLVVIDSEAFASCKELELVIVYEKLRHIGIGAFEGCSKLHTLFANHTNLISVGSHAFRQCKSLETIFLPDSVSSIGAAAFKDCESLIGFKNPIRNRVIEPKTFEGCTSLKRFTVMRNVAIAKDALPDSIESTKLIGGGSCD